MKSNILVRILSFVFLCICITCTQAVKNGKVVSPKRVSHCLVVVDRSFYEGTSVWRDNIESLMKKLCDDMENNFEISINVDTIITFDIEQYSCTDKTEMTCLFENMPVSKPDFIVHFFRRGGYLPYEVLEVTRPDLGYVAVKQMTNIDINMRFHYLYTTLFHEICHLYGAVHVYGNASENYLMNPYVIDNVVKVGKTLQMQEPIIDKANRAIVLAMAKRGFKKSDWNAEKWSIIERVYLKQLEFYNSSRINDNGILENFYSDMISPQDVYNVLAMWAGVCGNDSAACYWYDKGIDYYSTICRSCKLINSGAMSKYVCNTLINRNVESDVKLFKTVILFNKALASLRAGKIDRADNLIADLMVKSKEYPEYAKYWRELEDQYGWEKTIAKANNP